MDERQFLRFRRRLLVTCSDADCSASSVAKSGSSGDSSEVDRRRGFDSRRLHHRPKSATAGAAAWRLRSIASSTGRPERADAGQAGIGAAVDEESQTRVGVWHR